MTLVQLQYIVAVENFGGFAEAARRIFVTQPTLSMQIKKLETELDVIIFDRSRQPVKSTETGGKIIEQARNILKEEKKIFEIVMEDTNKISGNFRFGVIPTIAPYLLPLFLKKFTQKYRSITLTINENETDEIIKKLKRDELDAGILATPLYDDDIIERPLYYEEFLAFISKSHALFNKKKISHNELDLSDIWLLKEGHCFRDQVINICKGLKPESGTPHQLNFEAGSFDTLIKLVEKDFGLTLLPYLAVKELNKIKREKYIREFVNPVPRREVSIVYHRRFIKKKIIDKIASEISEVLPKEIPRKKKGFLVELR